VKVFALFGRPEVLRAFHGWCTLLWIPVTVLAFFLGWLESVTFVSLISMLALFLGSFSSWQAARTEVKQEHQMKKMDEQIDDVEEDNGTG
jgi:hypothetical protein